MNVTVLYFDGCPNWTLARDRAQEAIGVVGAPAIVEGQRVESLEEAQEVGSSGSPTILIDGEDLFPGSGEVAMACRLYGGGEHSLRG